jgi:hypothetical protein
MLTCATLFCWAKPWPRETISGLFGRKAAGAPFDVRSPRWVTRFWIKGARFINAIHRSEADHCMETAALENQARHCLGYHQ